MRKIGTHPGMPEGQRRRKKKMKTIEQVLNFEIKELKKQRAELNDGDKIYPSIVKTCLAVAQASIKNANSLEEAEDKISALSKGMQALVDSITSKQSEFQQKKLKLDAKLEVLCKLLEEDRILRSGDDNDDME